MVFVLLFFIFYSFSYFICGNMRVCVCVCVEGLWSVEPNRFFDRFGAGGGHWRRHLGRSLSTAAGLDSVDGGGGGGHCGHPYRSPVHCLYTVFTTPVSFFSWQQRWPQPSVASATAPTSTPTTTASVLHPVTLLHAAWPSRSRGRRWSDSRHRIPR